MEVHDMAERTLVAMVLVFTAIPLVAAEAGTQTVYRAVDEHGVVTFSDQAMPNAEAIELSVTAPSPESLEEANRRLESDLEWLSYLEESRREAADREHEDRMNELELARARAELERAHGPEQTYDDDRYDYPYGYFPPHRPRPPHRPDRPYVRPPFAPPPFAPPAFGQNQQGATLEPSPPSMPSQLPSRH
jgi:hypothetical protein